ncbi:ABC transporter ATP-binding protein [Halarcobacter mediterraneus]|uniref:ABC transporter ATP-binding protein n=1 Tax=Halarcobacter mediterraneus TaxID=2023153 RepID=A0A4Q1AX24_9BACT|nr:ABC transporter ATP-binding protein [Halarcobacter mediterraneus]RXK14645.1 ABC transporter ATP-binding protein [Halarcobacter mediterraneus]
MLSIEKLNFSYKKKALYKDLSINFRKSHIYGLFGKNGSGKTTLLGLISGTLFSKEGKIRTLGFDPKNRETSMLSEIFYLPEQFILPELSSKNFVKLYSSFYPNFSITEYKEYSNSLEIEDSKNLKNLSMGQQKKFLLAFGLACNCKLNILDEPTNGLDIPSKSVFRRLVSSCIDETKCFIISTHQVKDIENIIDYVCILNNAEFVLDISLEYLSKIIEMKIQDSVSGEELYTEAIALGQYSVIKENKSGNTSNIDMELLFNASILDNSKLQEFCKGKENEK